MKRIIVSLLAFLQIFHFSGTYATGNNTISLVAISEDGKLQYSPFSDKGDILPDFSYVGYKHGEEPIPDVLVKKTVTPSGGQRQDPGNIMGYLKEEVLSGEINNNNYESIILRSYSTTGNVNTGYELWKAIDGINDDSDNRWKYNSQATKGQKNITFDLHTNLSPKPFNNVVIYYYCTNPSPTPEDSFLGEFNLTIFDNDELGGTKTEIKFSKINEKRINTRQRRYIVEFDEDITARYITMSFKTNKPNEHNPEIMEIELYNDDSQMIQRAIDEVSELTPDESGIRGAVLLEKGTYIVSKPLEISKSGVVLRGEGQGEDGTVLYANDKKKYNIINVSGMGGRLEEEGTRKEVIDEYVPVGAQCVQVFDPSPYMKGDEIVLHVQKNQAWIDLLGMGEGGVLDVPGMNIWTTGTYQYHYEKKITAIEGNLIYFDVPIVDSLNKDYDLTEIYKVSWQDRIENCGVENLRIESYFDPSIESNKNRPEWRTYSDENHAVVGVTIDNALDSWAKNVTVQYMVSGCVHILGNAKRITVEECEFLEGVSPILGGYRSPFSVSGQQNLVRDCYAFKARHDFVMGQRAPGPNVFSRCTAENSYSTSETHQRWTAGVLYDNVSVSGPNGMMSAANRGASGTGHGWTGAQIVFWNCDTPLIIAMKPPTAQNFIIGAGGDLCNSGLNSDLTGSLAWFNNQAGTNFTYDDSFAVGDAYVEGIDNLAHPLSLYEKQYEERVGRNRANLKLMKTLENGEMKNIDILETGFLLAEAMVKNTSRETQRYLLIAALYYGNELVGISGMSADEKNIDSQKQDKLIAEIYVDDTDNVRLSVFLWEGLDTMTPILGKRDFANAHTPDL